MDWAGWALFGLVATAALTVIMIAAQLGVATWWLGALLGLLHVAVALSVLVPLLVGIHPRMASGRAGPGSTAVLEPPGLLGLNYGPQTRRWPSSPMSPTASRSACC